MMRTVARLALALLLAGAGSHAWALEAREQVQFADGLYARGLWDVALKEYTTALKQTTNQATEAMIRYRMGGVPSVARAHERSRTLLRPCGHASGGGRVSGAVGHAAR